MAVFSVTSGTAGAHEMQERLVQLLGLGGELRRDIHLYAGLAKSRKALPRHQRIGVADRRDDARDARLDQCVDARRRAALVRAGLQVQIEGGAARLLGGLRQGDDFGVVKPGVGVKAPSHHFAFTHQDRSHQRIGTGQRPAFARQVERFAHVLRGHFSKSDSMNFSESKGSRSSIFSPTPI